MRDIDLFQMALGLTPLWRVSDAKFNLKKKRLDIRIDFPRGSTFTCPGCGQAGIKAYDTQKKSWRHLNFFQHEAYLTARVPRIKCDNCGMWLVDVPWARSGSGFTLLFESIIMTIAKSMPVKNIAEFINEHDTRLWRLYVDAAKDKADHSSVHKVGMDETFSKRGQNYVSLFVDLEGPKVLFATEGKDAFTVKCFKQDLTDYSGEPEAIEEMCGDMSPSFISGVEKYFHNAHLTFDKFHSMKIVNEAVDEVRRQEQKDCPEFFRTRYIWLKNFKNLKPSQTKTLEELTIKKLNLKTSRAHHIKLNFQELFNQPAEDAEVYLKKWYSWAIHSRLEPIKEATYTIKRHWDGVLRWFQSNVNNGILEGINSLVQAAKARSCGYCTTRNLITIIYLIAGKLKLVLPS